MRMTTREIMLLLITLVIALFGATALFARPKYREWKEMGVRREALRADIERDRMMVNSRDRWASELITLSKELPHFGASERMDTHWLSTMEAIAARNGVNIMRRQAGEERRMGDVFELPIECRDWEAELEPLVKFLFDLQSQGAMLDVRHLLVKPKSAGTLRGRLSLSCAYTRQTEEGL